MKILGTSSVSLQAAQAWATARGAHQRFIDVAVHYWNMAHHYGIPPEVLYAQAAHETNKGKYTGVVPWTHHNWAGIKTKDGWSDTDPAHHQVFPNDATGVLAQIQHLWRYASKSHTVDKLPAGHALVDPRFHAITKFTDSVEGLGGAWAPSLSYGTGLLPIIVDIRKFANDGSWQVAVPRIALSAGHHNTSGGNALEYRQVGELTEAIAAACRSRGMDVRVITPDGPDPDNDPGDGDFPGNLSAAAAKVVEWSNAGWRADVFLEVHTEGAGPNARGAFAIYPDWGDDVDTDVMSPLGPDIVIGLRNATGMPVRGTGVMSEKQTGVGAGGDRLGIFGATASIRDFCTRLIVEFGSHDSAADLAIFNAPTFNAKAGAVVADAFAEFLNFHGGTPQPGPVRPPEVSDPNARYFSETGYWIQWGFRGYWESYGDRALMTFGYPLSNELTEDGRPVQYFERAVFEWHADIGMVLLRRLGADALERKAA